MRAAAFVVQLAGAALTFWMMVDAWDFSPGGWGAFLAFSAWSLSPYLGLYAMARRRLAPPRWRAIALAVSLVVAFMGGWSYVQGFLVSPDPQSGLLFIFVPLWQWIAVATAMVLAAIVGSRALAKLGPPP